MSGAMGGSASEEFLAPLEIGEDTFVRCASCGYAANVEAFVTPRPAADPVRRPARRRRPRHAGHADDRHARRRSSTRDAELRHPDRDWTAADTLKNVIVKLRHPDGTRRAAGDRLPGDREVDMKRLEAQVAPAEVEPFTDDGLRRAPGRWPRATSGPASSGSASRPASATCVDPRVVAGTSWITGADTSGRHVIGLVAGRDFTPDGTIEAAEIRDGDVCPTCGSTVEIARGIEIGHIFQLGRKYAEALELTVQDENGRPVTPTMGSYGVGVSRCVAAIAESTLDDIGLCWPREISPGRRARRDRRQGRRTAAPRRRGAVGRTRSGRPARCCSTTVPGVSPGVRFKDAELIGIPTIVVVGRGIADESNPTIEVKDRRSGERVDVALADAVAHLVAVCAH